MSRTLVFIEATSGSPSDISLQALAKAQQITPGQVTALIAGRGAAASAASLFGQGADAVLAADHESLKEYLPGPFLAAVQTAAGTGSFSLILFPASTTGNDLAPLLAAQMNAACVLDASDVSIEGGKPTAVRVEFDRKVASSYAASGGGPLIVSVKDGIIAVPPADAARTGAVAPLAFTPPASRARVLKRDVVAKSVNLKDAKIIVGAGAGIGSKDNFGRIRELADALNAEIGATRAVVDAGWLPADHQIGQTGATVRPELYLACGVSGAVQHWVGISEARTIIAINTDKSAPLMKHAHYRVIGDVNAIIPKLIKILKAGG